jgi:hypothetical protein
VQTKPLQDEGSLRHKVLVGEVRPEQDVETLDSTATGGVGQMSSACRSPWSAWAFVVNFVSSDHGTLRLGSTMDRADQPGLPLTMSLHVFHLQLIIKFSDAQGDACLVSTIVSAYYPTPSTQLRQYILAFIGADVFCKSCSWSSTSSAAMGKHQKRYIVFKQVHDNPFKSAKNLQLERRNREAEAAAAVAAAAAEVCSWSLSTGR